MTLIDGLEICLAPLCAHFPFKRDKPRKHCGETTSLTWSPIKLDFLKTFFPTRFDLIQFILMPLLVYPRSQFNLAHRHPRRSVPLDVRLQPSEHLFPSVIDWAKYEAKPFQFYKLVFRQLFSAYRVALSGNPVVQFLIGKRRWQLLAIVLAFKFNQL